MCLPAYASEFFANSKPVIKKWYYMGKYEPTVIGFDWNDDEPRIQLEPIGERGYIELNAVKCK